MGLPSPDKRTGGNDGIVVPELKTRGEAKLDWADEVEQAIPSVTDYVEKKKETAQVQVTAWSNLPPVFSSPIEELICRYNDNFVDFFRATMKYYEELKVHPDSEMEETKEGQMKQPGSLYRLPTKWP